MLRTSVISTAIATALVSAAVLAAPPPVNIHPELKAIARAVEATNLHASDAALVGFGTRNTTLLLKSRTRGIIAARAWAKAQFEQISKHCGGCIRVTMPTQSFVGPRIPQQDGVPVTDVVAIQRGTTDPDRVIVMTAHIDSINSNGFKTHWQDNRGDAPGANDDAAGVSALIETARVLAQYKFPATLVYSADSGEEQGLYGGSIIAQYAVDQGWNVEADINNDMVGNDHGGNGVYAPHFVRLFSEGTKSNSTLQQLAMARFLGSEVDSPSRNVARYMQVLADQYLDDFKVHLMYRTDRWGRSGDQVPFLQQGFPAVRISESAEDYNRQHQDVRVENGVHYGDVIRWVDFDYLANVTRLDAITMASLAMAPMPPTGLEAKGALEYDTTLTWKPSPGAVSYNAWWRKTDVPQWQHMQNAGDADSTVLKNVILDDWFVGVSAVGKDGWESPVEFPRFTGSFERDPKVGPDGKPLGVRYPSPFGPQSGHAVGPASWPPAAASDAPAAKP